MLVLKMLLTKVRVELVRNNLLYVPVAVFLYINLKLLLMGRYYFKSNNSNMPLVKKLITN